MVIEYTHNLKIILIEKNSNVIIEDEAVLDEIKSILSKLRNVKLHYKELK